MPDSAEVRITQLAVSCTYLIASANCATKSTEIALRYLGRFILNMYTPLSSGSTLKTSAPVLKRRSA
jgi:hypothetical protein